MIRLRDLRRLSRGLRFRLTAIYAGRTFNALVRAVAVSVDGKGMPCTVKEGDRIGPTVQSGTFIINADGTFNLKDPLPVGAYKVYLAPKVDTASDQPKPVTMDKNVPDKYWNEASTDISVQVVAGVNDVTVPLTR